MKYYFKIWLILLYILNFLHLPPSPCALPAADQSFDFFPDFIFFFKSLASSLPLPNSRLSPRLFHITHLSYFTVNLPTYLFSNYPNPDNYSEICSKAPVPSSPSTSFLLYNRRLSRHLMEGLTVSKANLTVYIHPSMSNKVRGAILSQLSSLLFAYNDEFEGVLLAYEVHARDKSARILPGLVPCYGVKLRATLLLFAPKPNMLIEGKVVKVGRESIHAVVLGFSSAAIMLGDIREELKYKVKNGAESFSSKSHNQHVIKVGSFIRFAVKSMDEEILHISGSLAPHHTGCIHWLSKNGMEHDPQTERKSISKRDLEKKQNPDSSLPTDRPRPQKSRRTEKE